MARRRRTPQHGRDPFEALEGRVRAVLDLHGFTAAEARAATTDFLEREAHRQPGSLVHVVTGKGRGSAGRPVLLPRIRRLLQSGELKCVLDWGTDLDGGGFLIRLR